MDMSALASAGQAFTALRTIASALVDVRDFTKLGTVRAELLQRILDAQGAMLDAQTALSTQFQEIGALKAEIAELKQAAAKRESYALHEIRPGAFVYRSKLPVTPTTPMHDVCQPCFDKGVKAISVSTRTSLGMNHECPTCRWRVYG